LRQLLQMRSGLRNHETADPQSDGDSVRLLFLDGRDDGAAYAEAQPLEAEPGRHFDYSTATAAILADVATRALTDSADPGIRHQVMADYLRTRLSEPLGMRSLLAEYDARGTLQGGSMIHATARDWGRFGEFLRNQGSVRGAQVVPRAWVSLITHPSPANPAYGAQVWLNRPTRVGKDELFAARGPADLFAMVGHLGQYVLVSPSRHLTVVRLGKSDEDERRRLRDGLADLVGLFSAEN
jgi:CubicO group peptidase (beta-lactamase class C family)